MAFTGRTEELDEVIAYPELILPWLLESLSHCNLRVCQLHTSCSPYKTKQDKTKVKLIRSCFVPHLLSFCLVCCWVPQRHRLRQAARRPDLLDGPESSLRNTRHSDRGSSQCGRSSTGGVSWCAGLPLLFYFTDRPHFSVRRAITLPRQLRLFCFCLLLSLDNLHLQIYQMMNMLSFIQCKFIKLTDSNINIWVKNIYINKQKV